MQNSGNNKWYVGEEGIARGVERAWDRLLEDHRSRFGEITPSNKPISYLLGGQPGAGKSTQRERIVEERFNGNALFISMDDFREYHPFSDQIQAEDKKHYGEITHPFASAISEAIIEKAISAKYNIIVETTLKSYENAKKLLDNFHDRDYETNVTIVTCPASLSLFSTVDRQEQAYFSGDVERSVPTIFHEEAVENLPKNAQKIYDNLKYINILEIYARPSKELWSNQDPEKYKDISPLEALKAELQRTMSKDELEIIYQRSAVHIETKKIAEEAIAKLKILIPKFNKSQEALNGAMKRLDELGSSQAKNDIVEASEVGSGFSRKIDRKLLETNLEKQSAKIKEAAAQVKDSSWQLESVKNEIDRNAKLLGQRYDELDNPQKLAEKYRIKARSLGEDLGR